MVTMKQLYDADIENIETDYEALMKAEAIQRDAYEKASEAKMDLLAKQREVAIARAQQRYGVEETTVAGVVAKAG